MVTSSFTLFISLLGGILPALLWLWFWLQEDNEHPEPRRRIIIAFFSGMLAVLLVLPIEKFLYAVLGGTITTFTIFSWAAAEEILKFGVAYFFSLRKNIWNDEPIDALIYLVSTALGFSALENSLFLLNIVNSGPITQSIITGDMRFIGATLLHTLSSAAVGAFIAFGFYLDRESKRGHMFTGVVAAVILHTLFNWLIIKPNNNLFLVFGAVWLCIVSVILIIERIKLIKNTNNYVQR